MSNNKVTVWGQKSKRPTPISAILVLDKNQIFKGIALVAKKTVV